MKLFSHLIQEHAIRVLGCHLLISCSDFVIPSLKSLPSLSNSLCFGFRFSMCLLELHACTQIYFVLEIQLLLQHLGCSCLLVKLLISTLLLCACQNQSLPRRPGVVLTNEIVSSALQLWPVSKSTKRGVGTCYDAATIIMYAGVMINSL